MGLQGFERKLENMVEGAFARVFRSGLRPIELGRRMTREMDNGRSVDVRGRTVVPNAFVFNLSATDRERFSEIETTLGRELADAAREHAHDERYAFLGPVSVEFGVDDRLRAGVFVLDARMKEGPGGTGFGSLMLPTDERYPLDNRPVVIGRHPDCDITLLDPNVSRRHAEIRPGANGFILVDLGSTNGSKVNGVPVGERELRDGDEMTFGGTRIVFHAV